MTDKTKSKSAFIISDFDDVGTGEHFTAGAIANIPEGQFANYFAAGLVSVPTAEDVKAAKAA